MKRIILIFSFCFLFASVAKADTFDYRNGYLDIYQNWHITTVGDVRNVARLTDNIINPSTYVYLGTTSTKASITIHLSQPIELELLAYYIDTNLADFGYNIKFFEEGATTSFYSRDFKGKGAFYVQLERKVKLERIVLTGGSGVAHLNEFDFFIVNNVGQIENFYVTQDFDEITVNADMPENIKEIRFLIDGKDAGSSTTGKHVIKNLKANTQYTVGLVAIDKTGAAGKVTNVVVNTNPLPQMQEGTVTVASASDFAINLRLNAARLPKLPKQVHYTMNGQTYTQNVADSLDFTINQLETGKEYTIDYKVDYGNENVTNKQSLTAQTKDTTPTKPVDGLKATRTAEGVKLTYNFPTDKDFSHVAIYRNGTVIAKELKVTSYIDKKIEPNAKYTYKVIAYDTSGNASQDAETTITISSDEVTKLAANAKTFDQVNLSWENTKNPTFESVKIYRKEKTSGIMKMFFLNVSASDGNEDADGYKPLFETNGTTFKDLTVEPDTSYTYKVTSVVDGKESAGKTVEIKTPEIQVIGGDIQPNPKPGNPDDPNNPGNPGEIESYTVTWEKPTTGKLKVLVGGKEYAIVNAADKKIIIPAKDMKFNGAGLMDVQLVVLDEEGNEIGNVVSPGKGGLPGAAADINAPNTLKAGLGLLSLVGVFVLLGLAFLVVPKLIRMIRDAVALRSEGVRR